MQRTDEQRERGHFLEPALVDEHRERRVVGESVAEGDLLLGGESIDLSQQVERDAAALELGVDERLEGERRGHGFAGEPHADRHHGGAGDEAAGAGLPRDHADGRTAGALLHQPVEVRLAWSAFGPDFSGELKAGRGVFRSVSRGRPGLLLKHASDLRSL